MRIGKVCEKTGLSERTIRYYCEEGLIYPQKHNVSGRTYSDYSEKDVARLVTIATLRRALFTIDELKQMLSSPDKIPMILGEYNERIIKEKQLRIDIFNQINSIDFSCVSSVDDLATRMESVAHRMELPPRDVNPDFSKFDTESREQKDAEYASYEKRQANRYLWGKRIVIGIVAVNIIFSLISNLFININIVTLILDIVFSIMLLRGIGWVRYLYIASDIINIFAYITLLATLFTEYFTELGALSTQQPLLLLYAGLIFIKAITGSLLLIFHKGVHEFLYAQKNG